MHFSTLTTAALVFAGMGLASPMWQDSANAPTPPSPPSPPTGMPGGPPKPPGPPAPPSHPSPPGGPGNGPPKPPGPPGGPGAQPSGLNAAMRARGKDWFGSAITIRNDTTERAILSNINEIGSLTPENAMKWETTEPGRGNFTFADADAVVAFAQSNGQQLHCHNLVWHSQLAPWVTAGNFDNATLIQVMKDHIYGVAGRYKDVCTRWDVVNEALNENGTYRQSVWYDTIGEAFIPLAFKFAAEATPKSKLYYNDYNLESGEDKTAGAARIVQLIQSYGLRIDGVGFQAHLASEETPTSGGPAPSREVLVGSLETMTNLGVDVAYTELDIRMNTPATEEKLQVQAEAYERVVGSCMDVKRCRGITVWGISDKYSWIPGTFPGEGAALLWDENFQKKPAYNATLETILISRP